MKNDASPTPQARPPADLYAVYLTARLGAMAGLKPAPDDGDAVYLVARNLGWYDGSAPVTRFLDRGEVEAVVAEKLGASQRSTHREELLSVLALKLRGDFRARMRRMGEEDPARVFLTKILDDLDAWIVEQRKGGAS